MELNTYNIPQFSEADTNQLPKSDPAFLTYEPDFLGMRRLVKLYENKTDILVIGHGGSITTFYAVYHALKDQAQKKAHFLWTIDPSRIAELKAELDPETTLVVAISKSGQTITQLEALSAFLDYEAVVISEAGSPLWQIAEKMGWPTLLHPSIGGRYSGFTEVTLLPMMLCGLDAENYLRGGQEAFRNFKKPSLSWKLAGAMKILEAQGFVDVLGLVYSSKLAFSQNLLMQLAHESYGKQNFGQTFLFCEGPEVQHHTLQRLLGGPKNMVALFVTVYADSPRLRVSFPPNLHSIGVKNHRLADFQNEDLHQVLRYEAQANLEYVVKQGLPTVHLELPSTEASHIGRWIGFWLCFTVYGASLRGVDPFDQPEVEHGKVIAIEKRMKKGETRNI